MDEPGKWLAFFFKFLFVKCELSQQWGEMFPEAESKPNTTF